MIDDIVHLRVLKAHSFDLISQAGTARPHSDIDLAIEYHGILAEKDLNAFRSWLDDLPTLYRIDLVDMNSAGEKLKAEIKRYGKIL